MNKSFRKNKGVVTLLTTVVVLVMMTLMVIFATKVGMFDQRMAGNEARYKEAFATAEAGLDLAIQRFDNKFRAAGELIIDNNGLADMTAILAASEVNVATNTQGELAAANTASFTVTITETGERVGAIPVYNFTSTGIGEDGTGTAVITRQISMRKALGGDSPDVPIVVAGSVGTEGDFNIVANPNGAGPGVPVSIWTGPGATETEGNVTLGGSSATCHAEYFDGNNPQCSNPSGNSELLSQGDGTTATEYTTNFPDVLPNDPSFPDDLFQYLFGVTVSNWRVVKNLAATNEQLVSSCEGLDVNAGDEYIIWWVDGDCEMGSNQIIGSTAKPVILVVDDHKFDMRGANPRLYGILYVFDNPDNNETTPSAEFNGSPAIYGALVSDVGGSAMKGSYSIVYHSKLLDNLAGGRNTSSYDLASIPGSWRDFQ